ncbi:MAG: hypothetical protein LBH12_03620 [Dysgonamonadaceae bacterium]|nr:hypothetical protein [Dysgonamonadaceae bacterium]
MPLVEVTLWSLGYSFRSSNEPSFGSMFAPIVTCARMGAPISSTAISAVTLTFN